MKFTRDRIRIIAGVVLSASGAMVSVYVLKDVYAILSHPHQTALGLAGTGRALGAGLVMVIGGLGLFIDLKSDPPPRKDPWDE